MKSLSQKGKKEPVHVLNEQEIQERLYGRYHKKEAPFHKELHATQQNVLTPPHFEIAETPAWKEAGRWIAESARAFTRSLKMFPWKLALVLSVALVITIFLSRSMPAWLETWKEKQTLPLQEHLSRPMQETVRTVPIEKSLLQEPRQKGFVAPAQKFYTVQVCTYQRERDAQVLVHELQALQFPAFYQRASTRDQGIALYLVFLGHSLSYADAKVQLEEFRKSSLFHKFSDSFIRSVTNPRAAT